jgi:hypothetical protein
MSYPNPIKRRGKIEALTGIKSSLEGIRPVISLVYLLYVANGRLSRVEYCESTAVGKIIFKSNLLAKISNYLGNADIENIIKGNPLVVNQYEPLYVAITLLFKLGCLKMEGRVGNAERKGGLRYPKQLYFATNIVMLDLILSRFPHDILSKSLVCWLNNHPADNQDFEETICSFLALCTEYTEFKIRDEQGRAIFFQTEGVYSALSEGKLDLTINDSKESVGPTRIYKNVIKEKIEPWLFQNNNVLSFTAFDKPTAKELSSIISTTLDINNVSDDSIGNTTDHLLLSDGEWEQKIYFGTPGSGKSWTIKKNYEMTFSDGEYRIDKEKSKRVVRITFHPDMDYAQFVGCYKPKTYGGGDEKKISYEFTPQAFTEAYVKAWSNTGMYYLVIEEINRGNCAQIFGDLFQLLDRNKDGYSEYPIKADNDLKDYLVAHLPEDSEGIRDGKLCLPPNLSIIASMNTSDQSLFPMDSAFKRRWSWEYVPIDYENAESGKFEITIDGESHNWHKFLRAVNEKIKAVTSSEDKQMGNFFIKQSVDEKEFCDKVMFYLWSEVGKDNYQTTDAIFRYYAEDDKLKEFSFNELYDPSKRAEILKGFIRYIEEEKKQ